MGFIEGLTIMLIVLKFLGVITWSWWVIFAPETIAFVFYILAVLGLIHAIQD